MNQVDLTGLPAEQGLYSPFNEHDACGIGFIVNINGEPSHEIITKGIQILVNLSHRGACGCDSETGDGAGILIQIPDKFLRRETARLGFTLPSVGEYAVGMVFLPVEPQQRLICEGILERVSTEEGLAVLGWRDTPVERDAVGRVARASQPYIEQIFLRRPPGMDQEAFERQLYVVLKRVENEVATTQDVRDKGFFYIPSLSSRTIVYKGLLLAPQITNFYTDLADPDAMSALAMVHQRFSTNTFPTWQLAHPFRMLCHNGEINTVRGNNNWMYARQAVLQSPHFPDMKKLFPIVTANGSDSASLDNAVQLFRTAGRDLPHVMAMLIPEAWDADSTMSDEKRAFYEYHASLMEPWDGSAAVAFTDGKVIGATLDRNGLRP
ncbi:MAG: glutamate synthase subunit alpha, partial [Bryobacteraceae bacterium]|nr:glutamate synthase subunit alpha [Bryobacteraceae bacterium]